MQYAGFDPGTFQPWALNLVQNVLGQPGIARGMSVTPTNPATMGVNVTIDPVAGDGVCFLPNGGWVRIDAEATLTVPANTSGVQRQDAVVAYVDPTGTTAGGLYYLSGYSGSFAPSGNQLVLALVNVPNGASGIIDTNLIQTPLEASVGTALPNEPDVVIGDETPDVSQQGIFVANNVVLTSSALSAQTSFTVPLTASQRLVPIGKIGGATETGLFASPRGWYKPLVYGSVSGLLPVASVDALNGNIITSIGAQAGEQVSASFKYYDFDRDLMVWGGEMLLERNSPYLVYQSDCRPGTLFADLWSGTLGSVTLQVGDVVSMTTPSRWKRVHVAGIGGSAAYTIVQNGTPGWGPRYASPGNLPFPYSEGWPDYTGVATDSTPYLYTLTVDTGVMEFAGLHLYFTPTNNAYVDGGELLVEGQRVYVQSTSVPLPTWAGSQGGVGSLYVTRYGGVTSSSVLTASTEQSGGRIPVATAVQYGGMTNTSALWGVYALPNQPVGYQPHILLLNAGTFEQPHGWSLQNNLSSSYGMIAVSSYSQDALMLRAWCSGADMVATAQSTAPVSINVAGVTTYTTLIQPGGFVPVTLFTSLPATFYNVQVAALSSAGAFGVESVELRQPAFPQSPPGTTPLANYWLSSGSSILRRSFANDISVTNNTTSLVQTDVANNWDAPSFAVGLTTSFSGQMWQVHTYSYSTVTFTYKGGPGSGQAIVGVGNNTQLLDMYFATPTIGTVTISGANGYTDFTVWPLGTSNVSSTGTALELIALDTVQGPYTLLDARRNALDGLKPSARGSSLFSHKGEPLADAGYGIQTQHIADGAVTSRKMRVQRASAITTTGYSGFPGVDPYLSTTITVEVPSLLWVTVEASIHCNTQAGGLHQILVDGIATPLTSAGTSGIFNPTTTNNMVFDAVVHDQVAVGPGTHTITWSHHNDIQNWCPYPGYADSGSARTMSVIAFAL